MKAVLATEKTVPLLGTFRDPEARDGFDLVEVHAAALTNLDMAVAQGRHYFSPTSRPFVIGREAVASNAAGERRFHTAQSIPVPFGSMAERALVRSGLGLPVPDGVPDVLAAALGNAGLAAWLPLSWRARLQPGETVMILGATGISGLIAVAAARLLGAGRIVAAGRDRRMLARCKTLGANEVVDLGGRETLVEAMAAATHGGADVVIDYLNGGPAEAALETMATGGRMVQIGSLLAPAIRLNAGNARMRSLDVLGFAYYHAPQAEQAQAYARLCSHALAGEIEIATETYSLDDFPFAWDRQLRAPRARLVITP